MRKVTLYIECSSTYIGKKPRLSGYSACFPRSRYDDPIIVESWL